MKASANSKAASLVLYPSSARRWVLRVVHADGFVTRIGTRNLGVTLIALATSATSIVSVEVLV